MLRILLVFFLLAHSGYGQLTGTHFFNDTTNGKMSRMHSYIEMADGIIVSGEIIKPNGEEPLICKIAPDGHMIWTTLSSGIIGEPGWACESFDIQLFNDGYIYGVARLQTSSSNRKHFLWKVDPANGNIEYINEFFSGGLDPLRIREYNDTCFLAAYTDYDAQSVEKSYIAFMNKSNGDTLMTHESGTDTHAYGLQVDANKNIYYWHIGTLTKFNKADLDFPLWQRTYDDAPNEIDEIEEVYFDNTDHIFIFGRDGGTIGFGDSRAVSIDISTGDTLWTTNIFDQYSTGTEVKLSDFTDRNGKLYLSYRHALVGGIISHFSSLRLDKTTGNRDWYSNQEVTPLGSPTSASGGSDAALSIDIDCSGGVYLTGYYGDANYGDEAWGIMKLNESDGSKIYDLTITDDSVNYDNFSGGRAVCVFGDAPVILGHLQNPNSTNPWLSDAYYVSIDPVNGDVLDRHPLDGEHPLESRTLDIINDSDTLFVLKQQGKVTVIEAYSEFDNLIWSTVISDTGLVLGDQLSLSDNYVFVTSHVNYNDGLYPYDNGTTFRLYGQRFSKADGTLLNSGYALQNGSQTTPLELEADDNLAFVFYNRDGNNYLRKWTPGSQLQAETSIDLNGTASGFDGDINLVANYSPTELLIIGATSVNRIQKSSLVTSAVYTYPTARTYFDHLISDSVLYLVGTNTSGEKLVTAYDLSGDSVKWEQSYGTGTYYKISADSFGNFAVAGEENNGMTASMILQSNGLSVWDYQTDNITYPESKLLDCKVNAQRNCILLTGASINTDGSSDLLIVALNLYGDTLFTYFGEDQLGLNSTGYTIEIASDSSTLVGGAYNRLVTAREGFIFQFDAGYCYRAISGDTLNCANETSILNAWNGTGYQWYQDGTLLAGETNQSINVTETGMYNCIVSDACGTDSVYCSFSYTSLPLPVVILNSVADEFCSGDSSLISASSGIEYQWYHNGNILSDDTTDSIYADQPGLYNIMVTNSFGCTDSSSTGVQLMTYPEPAMAFTISPSSFCVSDAIITLDALPPGGTYSGPGVNADSFDPSSSGPGAFTINYSYTDPNGCISDTAVTVEVNEDTDSSFTVNAIDSYTLNGQTYTASGTYVQTIQNVNGCDSTITLTLELGFAGSEELTNDFQVYPNPTTGILTVVSDMETSHSIRIYNTPGQLIYQQEVFAKEIVIDLSDKESGVYFLHFDEQIVRILLE